MVLWHTVGLRSWLRGVKHRGAAIGVTFAVSVVASSCGVSAPTGILSGPKADAADPSLVEMRAHSHLEPCPAAQTKNGGLPPVTLPCLGGGRDVALETLRGPLIINLFQGECLPCRKEMPALESFYEDYGKEVPVIGIDTIDTIPGVALREAIQRGVTYPLLGDLDGRLQSTKFALSHVPMTWALDSHGTLHFLQAGGLKDESQIVALLDARADIHV